MSDGTQRPGSRAHDPDSDADSVRRLARSLREPRAYPGDASAADGVEHLETHISHLFLTGERVYKLRKPVRLSFLSFATRAERNADCAAELELNRRSSPEVYLGLAPVVCEGDRVEVGPALEPAELDPSREHCTVMLRLDEATCAKAMLERGTLEPRHLDLVARRVARLHAETALDRPTEGDADVFVERVRGKLLDSVALARGWPDSRIDPAEVEELARAYERVLEQRDAALRARPGRGRVVDGHGDLHLEHVWFDPRAPGPQLIDCLEFDPTLREIDVAAEIAFLAMDLDYRGAPALAHRLLSEYAAETDDFHLFKVVDLFLSHRALIRGTVAAIAGEDEGLPRERRSAAWQSAVRHLDLARSALAGPRDPGCVMVCGSIGTGKSSVAAGLATALSAVVVSSDRTRKSLAGLGAADRFDEAAHARAYSASGKQQVYEALLERAASVVASGRSVVLDATYARRADRERVRAWAERVGVPCVVIEVRCDPEVVRGRLAERERLGRDASDAGPAQLEQSLRAFEAPTEWPTARHWSIATGEEGWREALPGIARELERRFRRA